MLKNLSDIGFYSLFDQRAKNVSWTSRLERCELILTDRCNFNCVYCRGAKDDFKGDISLEEATLIVNLWANHFLRNIRFSGGEPTIWKPLLELIKHTRSFQCFEHIAISTNGSAELEYYKKLHNAGVNDFSISLDSCCSSTAEVMSGNKCDFDHIINIIKELSKITYTTVGVVLDDRNINELKQIIQFAQSLGVSDIRVIPSAQFNQKLDINVPTKLKILKYRIDNIQKGKHVRGLSEGDCNKCHLVKDDMCIAKGHHFPCVIYMRELGGPISDIYNKSLEQIREERRKWFENTNIFEDPICYKNCLDVCIEHNNKVEYYMSKKERVL